MRDEATGRVPSGDAGAAGDDAAARDDAAGTLFPLRLLGVGLIFAWDWSLGLIDVAGAMTAGSPAVTGNTVLVVVQIVTLALLAALTRRVGAISLHRSLFWVAAACGVVGPALLLAAGVGVPVPAAGVIGAMAVAGGALTGFSAAVLMLSWAEAYGRMDAGRVVLFGAIALVFGVACYALVAQSAEATRRASVCAIPLASYLMCWLSWRSVGHERRREHAGTLYTFPWKPVVLMGTCGFAAAFIDVALFSQGTAPHIVADAIVGLAVVAAVIALRSVVRPAWLVVASLVCMVAGIASVALAGAAGAAVASTLAMVSYVGVTFFTCTLLADICYRRDLPSLWLFGFALAARVLMDHVGGFAPLVFPELPRLAGSPLDLALMSVVGLLMVGVVAAVWAGERSLRSDWAMTSGRGGTCPPSASCCWPDARRRPRRAG